MSAAAKRHMEPGSKPFAHLGVWRRLGGLLWVLMAAACQRAADAQVVRDPLGPIRCFMMMDARQIASDTAIQLCAGAISDAPAQCFGIADDRVQSLASSKAVTLCEQATSTEPIECFMDLDAQGVFTEDQMIAYCRTTCAVGPPPPEVSSSACLSAASEQTDLSLQLAGELCLRASSPGPVQCFLAGQDLHTISDSKLITLCRETIECQYYNASPQAPVY